MLLSIRVVQEIFLVSSNCAVFPFFSPKIVWNIKYWWDINAAQFACFYSSLDSKPYWQHYKCQHLIHNTWTHFSRWRGIEMKPRCSWGWAWNCWKEKDEERRDAKKEVEQKERKEDGKEGKRNHSYWVLLKKSAGIINNPLPSAVKGEALPLLIQGSSLWDKQLCYGQKAICLSILTLQSILHIQGWNLFSDIGRTRYPLGQRQLSWNNLLTTNFRLARVTHCLEPIAYINTTNCTKLLEGFCHS